MLTRQDIDLSVVWGRLAGHQGGGWWWWGGRAVGHCEVCVTSGDIGRNHICNSSQSIVDQLAVKKILLLPLCVFFISDHSLSMVILSLKNKIGCIGHPKLFGLIRQLISPWLGATSISDLSTIWACCGVVCVEYDSCCFPVFLHE